MDFSSDVDNVSADVGQDVGEVEGRDTDYGDGDGVNDFDNTYNDVSAGNDRLDYEEGLDDIENQEGSQDRGDAEQDINNALEDFDDLPEDEKTKKWKEVNIMIPKCLRMNIRTMC